MKYQTIIIGAGAAGPMAATQASKNQQKTLLIEHTNKIGEKIRISGGGKCNFTNLNVNASNYLSDNPHFVKSALAQYNSADFIKMVNLYGIDYHEKTLGQLFCDRSSSQIIDMLVNICLQNKAQILLNSQVSSITKSDSFNVVTNQGSFSCNSLIIATGGLSIPKIGASNFGYDIAKQFGANIVSLKPALVPLTFDFSKYKSLHNLSGIAFEAKVNAGKINFLENILFTHKGLSGPAILQISSYLAKFNTLNIVINLLPTIDLAIIFKENRQNTILLSNLLKQYLPNKFVINALMSNFNDLRITDYNNQALNQICHLIHNFPVQLTGNEGYNKAEVTLGGVDTQMLSSKTLEFKKVRGLYFIGEVVDVTGWLGGYNFQWAWSSGFIAGNNTKFHK